MQVDGAFGLQGWMREGGNQVIGLSPRQKEYCECLLLGLREFEIASRMGISLCVVKQYAREVGRKLRVDPEKHIHIQTAMIIHEMRAEYGVRCHACGD
jgi:DNA-binding CsgD family transcriptional regulator